MVHTLKTAHYTVAGPLQLGAILAGASEEDLKALNDYGIPLGKAFQIQDDILGLFGSEEKFGKPTDSDLKEGKRTLLILKALEKCSPEEKEKIEGALGNQELSAEAAEEVRAIIKATGSLDYSRKLAGELIEQAKQSISQSNFKAEAKEFLLGIADYMLKRDY
jgi:geranylgeranyl diphosphate synthase type I